MLKLEIRRASRTPTTSQAATEETVLASAARALDDAIANTDIALDDYPTTAAALRQAAQRVLQACIDAGVLTSESPAGALHREESGWGKPIAVAEAPPREILAADVLDALAALLEQGDELVWREVE